MFAGIKDYFQKTPIKRRRLAIVVIGAGFLLPLVFFSVMFNMHGFIDNVFDYGPLLHAIIAILGMSILVALAVIIDLIVRSKQLSKHPRFPFILTWIIPALSIIIIISVSLFITLPRFIREGDTPPQLLLTDNSANLPGIALVFRTQDKTVNTIEWGQDGNFSQVVKEETPSHHHWLAFKGLEFGKAYVYRLNGKPEVEFKTPPSAGKPLRFAAAGDAHFGNAESRNDLTAKMLEYIKNPENNYSMFFMLGDGPHLGFMDSLWKETFTVISRCSSSIPLIYVIGNHDTLFGGLELYQDYLCPPGENDNSGKCLYKRIDINYTHFLILDLEWGMEVYTPSQEQWLIQQLESIPGNDWCIVMSHTFYYCSGSYQDGWAWYDNTQTIARLTPLFEKYGVDLVMSGHKHHSEILQKNGVTYVVMGSFGGPQGPERTYVSPASIWYKAVQFGFADVTITTDSADIVVRGHDGSEVHKTTINKR